MTEVIHERSPRSRGRVRCDDCGRRIPEGEQHISLMEFDDGTVREWRRCQPCEAVAGYVARWRGPYNSDYYADDFYEWAQEAMGGYQTPYAVFCDDNYPGAWEVRLLGLAVEALGAATDDLNPNRAWDDEAWAAFTWRMQTSPVINARRK